MGCYIMKLQYRLVISLFLIACIALPSIASATSGNQFRFTYVAKFTCGFDPQDVLFRVLPGQYATSVAMNNSNNRKSKIRVSVSLSFPPGALQAGPTSAPLDFELQPNEAASVACDQIPTAFFSDTELGPPYIQGVVIIESNRRLSVLATYTAAEANPDGTFSIRSVDVERIERTRGN